MQSWPWYGRKILLGDSERREIMVAACLGEAADLVRRAGRMPVSYFCR